jgi:hypothetical protein
MLLKPTDEVLKAVVLIGSKVQSSGSHLSAREIVERMHRADADGVFDSGTACEMARSFMQCYF